MTSFLDRYWWTGPTAFIISLALLLSSPVIFISLARLLADSEQAIRENRIIQCDTNARVRALQGQTAILPMCQNSLDQRS